MVWPGTGDHCGRVIVGHQDRAALEELYTLIRVYLHAAETDVGSLQSVLELLCRIARNQEDVLPLALLPVWSYAAVGGRDRRRVVAVAAAWRCLHLAGKLLNDVANSRCCVLLPAKPPADLINAGVSLIFLAQSILSQATAGGIPPTVTLTLHEEFSLTGLRAVSGQHLKMCPDTNDPWTHYQTVVSLRSGGPFALAMRAGALLRQGELDTGEGMTTVSPAEIQSLADYGHHLGLMLQLADDFNGVWRPQGQSDLLSGKPNWPLLYAERLADARQRDNLSAMLRGITDDPTIEAAAKALLVELNVPLAMAVTSEEHRCRAEAALGVFNESPARQALIALLRRASLVPQETIP